MQFYEEKKPSPIVYVFLYYFYLFIFFIFFFGRENFGGDDF